MIRYALSCAAGHEFEGWFSSSEDYDAQSARRLVTCPVCDSHEVRKQIMAPALATGAQREFAAGEPAMRAMMMEALGRIRRHVEANFDYVGDRFATEARAIHEGKAEDRGIYGQATPTEVKGLVEDGVPIAPLPPEPPKKSELN
ncbi:MAG TPA: DUF1178 family protein [Caulobacteraceae bacterium]|jgi:hypothetical protein|nr:DUF1178 family protein [Caulobacteraceae bacterium]